MQVYIKKIRNANDRNPKLYHPKQPALPAYPEQSEGEGLSKGSRGIVSDLLISHCGFHCEISTACKRSFTSLEVSLRTVPSLIFASRRVTMRMRLSCFTGNPTFWHMRRI